MSPRSPKTTIEEVRVARFGKLENTALRLSDGLSLVYGSNEAGKSTLAAFIASIVFGFPRRSGGGASLEGRDGRDGRDGRAGRAGLGGELVLRSGQQRFIARRMGHRAGGLTVRDEQGAPLELSALTDSWGGITRALFEQVFCIDVDVLRDFATLAAPALNETLFAAGIEGADGLVPALAQLRDEADSLFRPRGAKGLNQTLSELQVVRAELDALGDRPALWLDASREQALLEARLIHLQAELTRHDDDLQRLQRLVAASPAMLELAQLEDALRALPSAEPFPYDALPRLEALHQEQAERERDVAAAESALTSLDAELAALPTLPYRADHLGAAIEAWKTVATTAGQVPLRQERLRERKAQLLQQVERVVGSGGSGGSEALDGVVRASRLQSLEPLLRRLRAEEASAASMVESRRALAQSAATAASNARASVETLRRAVEGVAPGDAEQVHAAELGLGRRDADEHALAAVEAQLAGLLRRRAELDAQAPAAPSRRTRSNAGLRWATIGLAALALGAVMAWLVHSPLPLVVASLAATGCAWLWRRDVLAHGAAVVGWQAATARHLSTVASLEEELTHARARSASLRAAVEACDRLAQRAPGEAVALVRARVAARLEELRHLASSRVRLTDAQTHAQQAELAARDTSAAVDEARAALTQVREVLRSALAEAGLPDTLTSEAAIDACATLAGLMQRLESADAELDLVEADAATVDQAREVVLQALVSINPAAPPAASVSPVNMARALAELEAALARHTATHAKRAALETRRVERASALAATQASLLGTRTRLHEVLELGAVASVEAFRARASAAQQLAELTDRAAAARRTLRHHGFDGASVAAELPALSEASQRLNLVQAARLDVASQCAQTQEALGRVRERLQAFERSQEAAGLRADEELLIARAQRQATRATVVTLARSVLERCRAQYEATHQPSVVRRASALFESFTGGAYRSFRVHAEPKVLSVGDAHGTEWRLEQLSRGTRELALLSFRLAVVEDFGARRVALPLVLDDVLVSVDGPRMARVVEALAALSTHHQVIAFTCHRHVRAVFERQGAEVVELGPRAQLSLLVSETGRP